MGIGGLTMSYLEVSYAVRFQVEDAIRDSSVTGVQTCDFLFSSRRRHTRFKCDWSSDVCSSDLTDPRILILDDSTSAIDSATEDEIQKAIRRLLQGRTTLLITHRISQIRWADKIQIGRASCRERV